jgi:hypothetical protein
MKYTALLALVVCLSAPAATVRENEELGITEVNLEALEQAFDLDGARGLEKKPGACGEIKLTDAQTQSLKKAFIGHKKAQIQSQADLKIGGSDYLVAVMDTKGTKQAADTASTALGGAVAKMATNHMGFANEVLFDILTPDQRRPALMCMHQFHKAMAAAKLKKLCAPKPAPAPTPSPKP